MAQRPRTDPPMSCIVERRLYLGDRFGASSLALLRKAGVTHVVNATDDHPNFFPNQLSYYNCNLRDDLTEHIDFDGPLQFIHGALAQGGVVLVHCAAGVSRSASLVIGFL
eukprot:RCo055407